MFDRRTIVSAALVCLIVAAAGAAFWLWRAQERAAIASAGVPEIPDLSRWPAEFEREVREATAAVRDAGDPIDPLARLAGLYHVNAYSAQAIQSLDALRRLDPTNARWVYRLADLRLRVGEQDAAEEALRQTLKLDPAYLPAWFARAAILTRRGAIDEARECYARAAEAAPQDVRAAYFQIAFDAMYGDASESRRRLAELVQSNSGIADLHALLAELHAREGNRDGEEQERRRVLTANRELTHADPWVDELSRYCFDVERLGVLASEAIRERRLGVAEKLLKRAIRIAPSEPSSWDILQSLYQEMGRPADALGALETAAANFLDDPGLRAEQSKLLCALGRPEEAVSLLQDALRRWPDTAVLHAALGFALGNSGRPEAAASALREAVRLDPTLVEAQLNLGISLYAFAQIDASRTAVERALSMRPEFPEALALLASIALKSGDLVTAESTLFRLMSLRPDADSGLLFAELQLLKGANAELSGDYASAGGLYETGLEVAPGYGPLLRAVGLLAMRTKRLGAAIDAFERYLQSEPENAGAYLLLGNALRRADRVADARRTLQDGLRTSQRSGREDHAVQFQRALERLRGRSPQPERETDTAP